MQFRKKFTEKEFRGMSEKYRKRKSHVIRREWHGSFFLRLHRDPPKRIRHGAHKNDRGKDRAEVFDHELEDDFPLEQVAALGNFVLDLFHTDDSRYEQAGRDRRDRHHDGVGQKIEEIKELHSDHGNVRQRTISEAGECSEKDHDNGHKDGRFFPAPVQLILEGGYGALGQGDGACDRRKQDEEKEQDPCACSESHARKYLRKCDEHEGRSSLESIRVAAGEGKDGRNDHESGHDRDRSVKDLNIFRRILD